MGFLDLSKLLYDLCLPHCNFRIHRDWLGVLINSNISTYITGSSLIALGLTWWQAVIAIVIGNIIATVLVVLNSLPGAYYHSKLSR
jgi:cytosine/uracil/thiamine/allantoin permease